MPNPSPGMLEHLFLGGQGQSEEWKKREADRREGRGRKDWWNKPPPDAGSHDTPAATSRKPV